MQQTSYVKFLRGTIEAYQNLQQKDSDALYFVTSDQNSTSGQLYFGDKLIAGSANATIELKDITGILIENNIANNSLLVYDATQNMWIAKPISEALNVPVMIGAKLGYNGRSGLVPAPLAVDSEKYLRGDGTWNSPTSGLTAVVGNILNVGDSYYTPSAQNPTTIVNEINYLNEKLTWQNL